MIALHQFESDWILPNPSPFCLKAETWLRMAGLDYARQPWTPFGAPLGKAPYVVVDGEPIADSSVIQEQLTERFGVELDQGMTDAERGRGTLVQRTLEEHTYWVVMHIRWVDPAGWARYRPVIQASMPPVIGGLLAWSARRGVVKSAWAHGLARHPAAEIFRRGIADLDGLAAVLGDQPFVLGDQPRSVDAGVYAALEQIRVPLFQNPFVRHAVEHPQLTAYVERMRARYWADFDFSGTQ